MKYQGKSGTFVLARYDGRIHLGRIKSIWQDKYCSIYFNVNQIYHFYLSDVRPAHLSENEKMLWILENE